MSCVGAGIGGALIGLFGTRSYMMGGLGVFLFPNLIGPKGIDMTFYGAVIACVVAFVAGWGLSMLFGFSKEDLKEENKVKTTATVTNSDSEPQLATAMASSATATTTAAPETVEKELSLPKHC
jgi:Phosphotransferase system IIC components, glucose/maltose/N-acetylglucosamine-specific